MEKGSLEEYIKRCLEDEAGKRQEHQEQIQSLSQQIVATQHRLENLVTALADNVLPADIIKQRYQEEEIKKKQLEERLNELSLLDGSAPIDLDKFRELLQQELGNEDSRKAALQGLIEEIVVHPDYTMEVKYRIGGNDPVGSTPYPHESRYAHGGTYITSDNFPTQKNRCQDSVICTASRHLEDACTIRQNQLLIATPPLYPETTIVIECKSQSL